MRFVGLDAGHCAASLAPLVCQGAFVDFGLRRLLAVALLLLFLVL